MGDTCPSDYETNSESDYEDFTRDYEELTYTDLYLSRETHTEKKQKFNMAMFKFDSFQSADTDTSRSTVSSVVELLQLREIDAKAFLKEIFGPSTKKRRQTSVPARFLKHSQCEGISIEKYIQNEIKLQHMRECSSSGFRSLLEVAETKQHPALAKLVDLLCASTNMKMYDKVNFRHSSVWAKNFG